MLRELRNKLFVKDLKVESPAALSQEITLVSDSGLFSLGFYRAQLNQDQINQLEPGWASGLTHFFVEGFKLGLDPHPLFDTNFYVESNNDVDFSNENPLVHFLRAGWSEGRSPHPLVDLDSYMGLNSDLKELQINPLVHYVHSGASEGRNLCEFFDIRRYLEQVPATVPPVVGDPLTHFVMEGARMGCLPHPTFARAFSWQFRELAGTDQPKCYAKFRRLYSDEESILRVKALKHDFDAIAASGIFDKDYFSLQTGQSGSLEECILRYLERWSQDRLDPHPLFDSEFYARACSDVDFQYKNPFAHFLRMGYKENRNIHPLFDVEYYLNNDPTLREIGSNPLLHYLEVGSKELRNTSPFFIASDYLNALRRFRLMKNEVWSKIRRTGVRRELSAESAMGQKKISRAISKTAWPGEPSDALIHFLNYGLANGIYPSASFQLLFRVKVSTSQTKFLKVQFRDFHEPQLDTPGPYKSFSEQLFTIPLTLKKIANVVELFKYLRFQRKSQSFLKSEKIMLFAVHVANRTGAPLLLLRLIKDLHAKGWECLLIVDQKGELESEFLKYAHVISVEREKRIKVRADRTEKARQLLTFLFDDLKFPKPTAGILNSVETGDHAAVLSKLGIPATCLVHEIADAYDFNFLQNVFSNCQKVIFPATFVLLQAELKMRELKIPRVVVPSALLDEQFGTCNRGKARIAFREEIGAKESDFIALACAFPDLRKGIDLLVFVADYLRKRKPARNIRLVWIGADHVAPHSPLYYADWDIRQMGLGCIVQLIRSRNNLESAFVGSDVFILPSRQDPFPCVVHDAMAAQLPVVAFEDAGGTGEMLEGGGAKFAPYGDVVAFAEAIIFYSENEDRRVADGARNRQLVLEKFRFDEYSERILEQAVMDSRKDEVSSFAPSADAEISPLIASGDCCTSHSERNLSLN